MNQWLPDYDGAGTPYVVQVRRDGQFHGYRACDLSGLLNMLSDQAYAELIDEEPDTLDVWTLLPQYGPVPVRIVQELRTDIDMVAVTVSHRNPSVRNGNARDAWKHVTAYRPLMGA